MAEARQITCAKCQRTLPASSFNSGGFFACPSCETACRVEIFPAFFGEHFTASTGEALLIDAEASCFYHPQKKAVVVCEICGRFLCGLCDVALGDQHLCPACIETGRKKKKLKNLENERTLHDNVAVCLAFLPMFAVWPTLISAPAALYTVFRHWNSPGSILPRSKVRFVLAGVLALAQCVGWVILFGYLITHQR